MISSRTRVFSFRVVFFVAIAIVSVVIMLRYFNFSLSTDMFLQRKESALRESRPEKYIFNTATSTTAVEITLPKQEAVFHSIWGKVVMGTNTGIYQFDNGIQMRVLLEKNRLLSKIYFCRRQT